MDNNVLEIIKSFKETKKAIDEFVPLLVDYSDYSNNIKDAIDLIKDSNINELNEKLNFSIGKLGSVQKEIDKSILLLNEKYEKFSNQIDNFDKKINKKIDDIEKNNKTLVEELESKVSNDYKNIENNLNEKYKSLEEKLDEISSVIKTINDNNKSIKKIEESIKYIEEAFEQ